MNDIGQNLTNFLLIVIVLQLATLIRRIGTKAAITVAALFVLAAGEVRARQAEGMLPRAADTQQISAWPEPGGPLRIRLCPTQCSLTGPPEKPWDFRVEYGEGDHPARCPPLTHRGTGGSPKC